MRGHSLPDSGHMTTTPRQAVQALLDQPRLPDGDDERFIGYGVMGMPFASGHYLVLRDMVATSVGPAYRALWHRDLAGRWTIHTTRRPRVPANVQGRSFLPALTGKAYDQREYVFGQFVYHDYYDPRRSIRTRTHKLIVNFSSAPAFLDTSQSWRPRSTPRVPLNGPNSYHPPVELYDLRTDPLEMVNIADEPDAAPYLDDLGHRLLHWMKDVDDPILDGAIPSPLHHRALRA